MAYLPPDEALQLLQTSEPVIDCRSACSDAWSANRARAARLDRTGHWHELAILVMQIGYADDLTYYYLGRAAEGLGYRAAAMSYYRISEGLSPTEKACAREDPDACNGQVLPAAAETRLAELAAPPAPPKTAAKRPRPIRATSAALPKPKPATPPEPTQPTAPASGGTAAEPDFAAPPPIRR